MELPDTEHRTKECSLCGEYMRVHTREVTDRIPGLSQVVKHVVKEWVCPDCSYEEEVADDELE